MNKFLQKQYEQKEALFWKLQTTGWLAFGATRALNAFALGEDINFQITVIFSVIGGFLITVLLRIIYRKLRRSYLPPLTLILTIISCIVVSAILLSAIDIWIVLQTYYIDIQIYKFAGRTLYDVFVLLIWTGAYFIINYHFMLMEQKEMYLQAIAQAHQSQLQMLRYQLNPHFLFNTLNAISTLVLDNQSKEANTMLTKLSAFLRFSLVNQPQQKISLKEEIYALWLYLDIEKIRFQDRLILEFNIAKNTEKAMIPSLLLQPLVENAVKYAIAPMEDGGTISLTTSKNDNRLNIVLRDTGPGLPDNGILHDPESTSTGVGIANTRERLQKLYPKNHKFVARTHPDGGTEITINIPFEVSKNENIKENNNDE